MIDALDMFNSLQQEKEENHKKLMFQFKILNDFVSTLADSEVDGLTYNSKISADKSCVYEFATYLLFHLSYNLGVEIKDFNIYNNSDYDYYDLSLEIKNKGLYVIMQGGYGDPTVDETSVYITDLNAFNISFEDFS